MPLTVDRPVTTGLEELVIDFSDDRGLGRWRQVWSPDDEALSGDHWTGGEPQPIA